MCVLDPTDSDWWPGEETSEDPRERLVAVGKNEGWGQYTFRRWKCRLGDRLDRGPRRKADLSSG